MIRKQLLASLILIFCVSFIYADKPQGPEIEFDTERYDYGTVYTDNLPPTQISLEFTNTGTAPLVISNVRGCCGTRITQWPRSPINPGEKGIIDMEIRLAPRAHRISRTLTITSNSATSPTFIYRIVGEVVEAESNPPR